MGLQALMNVGYTHTIKYKLINCSWTIYGWLIMAAIGKDPHFLQKNPPIEFSGYGPVSGKTFAAREYPQKLPPVY